MREIRKIAIPFFSLKFETLQRRDHLKDRICFDFIFFFKVLISLLIIPFDPMVAIFQLLQSC